VLPVRVLLDNIGLEKVPVPMDRKARSNFVTEVAMRLDVAGKEELSDAVRLGWALGAYDEEIHVEIRKAEEEYKRKDKDGGRKPPPPGIATP
jgi:hypothetical protein